MGANAQTSVWTFTAGNVLTAAQMNDTARTGVPVFATTTTRDAAFGGTGEKTLAEGQLCFIEAAPKRFQVYNGTAWVDYDIEWTAWTPTFTNFTIGNGTIDCKYARIGKVVVMNGIVTLGTTSSMSTLLTLTFPVTASSRNIPNIGVGMMTDNGNNDFICYCQWASTTTFYIRPILGDQTYIRSGTSTSTVPFTWGSTDNFNFTAIYEAA